MCGPRKRTESGVVYLVAQELGYGELPDELFAGTPSLGSVCVALTHAMRKDTPKVMFIDVKGAFLYGEIQRSVYIELPHVDPQYGTVRGWEDMYRNTRCATDLG